MSLVVSERIEGLSKLPTWKYTITRCILCKKECTVSEETKKGSGTTRTVCSVCFRKKYLKKDLSALRIEPITEGQKREILKEQKRRERVIVGG